LLFTKPSKAIGVDVGSHSVKAVQMSKAGSRMRVDQVGYALVDRAQLNVDPVAAQADAVRNALDGMVTNQSVVVGALPGQTVVIRYPRLAEMPKEQLAQSIETEASQSIPYDRSEVFLDWTLLDSVREGDKAKLKILLVAAKYEVIESRVQVADAAGIRYGALGVDSLALADAAEGCDLLHPDETVALVNMGATTTSIHFVKGRVSNFIRDVSWGAKELIQAIAKGRRCDLPAAEKLLMYGDIKPEEPPPLPMDALPQEETPAEAPALGGLTGSLLDPLEDELASLGDPLPAAKPTIGHKETFKSLDELMAAPLTRLVSEIRRSFDYYEQQLYERPVDRLILSGGIAQVPVVQRILAEELGLERVEVADPSRSALWLGDGGVDRLRERPAQFMVAVGLATRGASQL
jgi:type IV pilus assembly protein PilM